MTMTRDRRASEEHFASRLNYLEDTIERAKARLERAVGAGQSHHGTQVERILALSGAVLSVRYSLGHPIQDLASSVAQLGTVWRSTYDTVAPRLEDPAWRSTLGSLSTAPGLAIAAVDLISWSVVLRQQEVVEQVLATPVVRDAKDPVVGHLAHMAGVAAPLDGSVAQPGLWGGWLDAATATQETRRDRFVDYVKTWAKVRSKAKVLTPSTSDFYDGQWAIDAAPLAVCLDLDDSAVRDLPDYPADLVDYGRRIR